MIEIGKAVLSLVYFMLSDQQSIRLSWNVIMQYHRVLYL